MTPRQVCAMCKAWDPPTKEHPGGWTECAVTLPDGSTCRGPLRTPMPRIEVSS